MHYRKLVLIIFCCVFVLAACGKASQEEVVQEIGEKWNEAKGYELSASMEIKTGSEPRTYDVNVWHTKPDFYRVEVTAQNEKVTQMIVRNEEGVFVVTPALSKTYKFQSDWPKQNSQAYLIGALAEDILADKKLQMEDGEDSYVFSAATRNGDKTGMPAQAITVEKKSLLPQRVAIFNEAGEEQIAITFKEVKLGITHKAEEYAVEKFLENGEKDTASADIENKEFQTHYPIIQWDNTKIVEEQAIDDQGTKRVILTYEGEKAFTLMQQPVVIEDTKLPVFAPGDPADLGFAIGAITDHSISWEKDGISFFIASNKLTREEMIEVAASVTAGSMK
ncbi:outer membrane lipoprotein carrier protein LolA [Solibacillus sp. CAU 1738]|uniref:LolA family protein n=1 Tax=Solibacillus sp. CAU 1738 TaxID=3140363 RepID=UPI003260BEB6